MNEYTITLLMRERQRQLLAEIRGTRPWLRLVRPPGRRIDWRQLLFSYLARCPQRHCCADGVLAHSRGRAE